MKDSQKGNISFVINCQKITKFNNDNCKTEDMFDKLSLHAVKYEKFKKKVFIYTLDEETEEQLSNFFKIKTNVSKAWFSNTITVTQTIYESFKKINLETACKIYLYLTKNHILKLPEVDIQGVPLIEGNKKKDLSEEDEVDDVHLKDLLCQIYDISDNEEDNSSSLSGEGIELNLINPM